MNEAAAAIRDLVKERDLYRDAMTSHAPTHAALIANVKRLDAEATRIRNNLAKNSGRPVLRGWNSEADDRLASIRFDLSILAPQLADALAEASDAAIEECAKIAKNGCLVPPDGGSPTEEEAAMCDDIAARIRALKSRQEKEAK